MTALILGSASPRRARLLESLGVSFEVLPSDIDETRLAEESAREYAVRTARDKALAVARRRRDAWVIGSDTVVAIDQEILGKPADEDDARAMLQRLSGERHRVLTAVALVAPEVRLHEEICEESVVHFRHLKIGEIDDYIDGGEPFDKAGAYAIQGGASAFITRLQGSYENVVGFPVDEVREMLLRAKVLPQRSGS